MCIEAIDIKLLHYENWHLIMSFFFKKKIGTKWIQLKKK